MKITDEINRMRAVRERKVHACRAESSIMVPAKVDLGEIAPLYDLFKCNANPEYKDNTKIFILLVYFMYSPVSLLEKGIRSKGVRRELARILGMSQNQVTMYFCEAKSLLFTHGGFRKETERLFDILHG